MSHDRYEQKGHIIRTQGHITGTFKIKKQCSLGKVYRGEIERKERKTLSIKSKYRIILEKGRQRTRVHNGGRTHSQESLY